MLLYIYTHFIISVFKWGIPETAAQLFLLYFK